MALSRNGADPRQQIHVWMPELVSKRGGIQTFSRCFVEALTDIVGRDSVSVMAKNDPRPSLESQQTFVRARGWGSWPSSVRSLIFFPGIIWRAMRDRPRLIITTHLNFGIAGYILKLISGIPYWCVAHGVEAWDLDRKSARLGLLKSDLVLAVSRYTRERLLKEHLLKAQQVVILPNTIHGEAIRPGPKPNYLMRRHAFTVRNKIVLTVARLAEPERYKGYDQVLRALATIQRDMPDVRYVLVGEGEDRRRIEALIRDLDICDLVVLAGGVSGKELADYYNLCDVFVMPSKAEGFGIVYLEALACGKPVVAGNSDGSAEPLQDGRLGVLLDVDDVAAIGSTLTSILNGNYPLPAIYSPQYLRDESLKRFGFESFKARLRSLLASFEQGAGSGERGAGRGGAGSREQGARSREGTSRQ